jgi:hypothetical protein
VRLLACRHQLLQLGLQRRDVGIHRLVEQRPLLGAQLLALLAELQALQLRHLEGQLLQLGIAPIDLVAVVLDALQ